MSATRYSFSPKPSAQQRWIKVVGLSLLILPILSWPWGLSLWLEGARIIAICALLYWIWQSKSLEQLTPFALTEDGKGHWSTGEVFQLSPYCRLMPLVVLLRTSDGGWIWCHRDSFNRTEWHRLCRIALAMRNVE